jgi:Mlc titration factor MtfA (ptsG expression regulator)
VIPRSTPGFSGTERSVSEKMFGFKTWRRKRILRQSRIHESLWRAAANRFTFVQALAGNELERLRQWVILFLHEKHIEGAQGLEIDDEVRYDIAIQACILILNLDLDYYAGWREIIVYPQEFVPRREYVDDAGVVHAYHEPLMGEAWERGPIILSYADVRPSDKTHGVNVVIHEFAHKLDMLNGEPNGYPPLHQGMDRAAWSRAFTSAYEDFCRRVDENETLPIDPYAAETPGEFFAVLTEVLFESPLALRQIYPEVYRQLCLFYRQDPGARISGSE